MFQQNAVTGVNARAGAAVSALANINAGSVRGGQNSISIYTNNRFKDLLEQMKTEYDTLLMTFQHTKAQRDEYEMKLKTQVSEMENFHNSIQQLERRHTKIKEQYERDILNLRRYLEASERETISSSSKSTPAPVGTLSGVSLTDSTKDGGIKPLSSLSKSSSGGDTVNTLPGLSAKPTVPPLPSGLSLKQPSDDKAVRAREGNGSLPAAKKPKKEELPSTSKLEKISKTKEKLTTGQNIKADGSSAVSNHEWQFSYLNAEKDKAQGERPGLDLMHCIDHESVVCCVRFNAKGTQLATGCKKTVQVFDVESGKRVFHVSHTTVSNGSKKDGANASSGEDQEYVRAVCFSPNSECLAAGMEMVNGMMTGIKIWDILTKTVMHTLHGHSQEVYSLDWSKDVIASGSGDQQVRLWDSKTGNCLHVLTDPNGPTEGVTSVTLSPDATLVAAGSLDHLIRLWNVQTGKQLESLSGHSESVYSIAFSHDGSRIVSGSLDKTVRLWEIATGKPKPPAILGTSDADWWHHPDIAPHRRAVESDLRKTPEPPDMSRLLLCAPFHTDFVLSVGFSPDGRWIITGSKDRSVVFWDMVTRRSVLKQMGYKNSVISVSSAPGSSVFATGSGDNHACIWKYKCQKYNDKWEV